MSFNTGSTCFANSNATSKEPRRSRVLRLAAPRSPTRRKASDRAVLFSRAEIGRQAVYRSDEVSNGTEFRRLSLCRFAGELQSLPNNVGLGDLASTRFDLDVGNERLGQAYCQGLHGIMCITCVSATQYVLVRATSRDSAIEREAGRRGHGFRDPDSIQFAGSAVEANTCLVMKGLPGLPSSAKPPRSDGEGRR